MELVAGCFAEAVHFRAKQSEGGSCLVVLARSGVDCVGQGFQLLQILGSLHVWLSSVFCFKILDRPHVLS